MKILIFVLMSFLALGFVWLVLLKIFAAWKVRQFLAKYEVDHEVVMSQATLWNLLFTENGKVACAGNPELAEKRAAAARAYGRAMKMLGLCLAVFLVLLIAMVVLRKTEVDLKDDQSLRIEGH